MIMPACLFVTASLIAICGMLLRYVVNSSSISASWLCVPDEGAADIVTASVSLLADFVSANEPFCLVSNEYLDWGLEVSYINALCVKC